MKELLTTAPVPDYPRNLAHTLRKWLERLRFEVAQEDNYRLTHVQGTWTDAAGQLYTALYVHYHPEGQPHTALFSLHVRPAGAPSSQCLISATHVRRGREARMMLLANDHYKKSRQAALAAGVLQPA